MLLLQQRNRCHRHRRLPHRLTRCSVDSAAAAATTATVAAAATTTSFRESGSVPAKSGDVVGAITASAAQGAGGASAASASAAGSSTAAGRASLRRDGAANPDSNRCGAVHARVAAIPADSSTPATSTSAGDDLAGIITDG
jgi:hypothetical protein